MVAPMATDPELPLPALLRAAWLRYAAAIRTALDDAGYDDVPRNGPYVLSAIATGDRPLAEIITALGVTKQAAGALVDTLVVRGYLTRETDPDDRRRLRVALSRRGRAVARVIRDAAADLDQELIDRAGAKHAATVRAALTAFTNNA
jgi:DNA-binding MarR family transcriptional regulator